MYYLDQNKTKFNESCVVKLIENFRSEEKILKVPNDLFYRGELKAITNPKNGNGFKLLGDKGKPILFISLKSKASKLPNYFDKYRRSEYGG